MAIEKDIKELTEAINKLTGVLRSATPSAFEKSAAVELQQLAKEQAEDLAKPAIVPSAADDLETLPQTLLTFDDVKGAFMSAAAVKGRAWAVDLLAAYGVKGKLTAEALAEDKYTAFVEDCKC